MPPKRKQSNDTVQPANKSQCVDESKLSFLEQFDNEMFYEICLFLDATTFRNLSLVNHRLNKFYTQCLEDMLDYDEFLSIMKTKGIDPRFSVFSVDHTKSTFAKNFKKLRKLNIEILFKALNRYPGGNCDEFILKFILSFDANKKPDLKKGKLYNWDGTIGGYKMTKMTSVRDFAPMLKSMMKLSLEPQNSYCTIDDNRTDRQEYDTKWSNIQVIVTAEGNHKLLTFEQKARYPNDRSQQKKQIDAVPPTAAITSMIEELQTFCGITTPSEESDTKSNSSKEPPEATIKKKMTFPNLTNDYPNLGTLLFNLE